MRQTSGTLNLAFLGCGAATRMHSRTLARLGRDIRLHYASRDGRKASLFRDRHRGAGAFASYGAAIEDAAMDVMLVATPPALHLDWTVRALEAGKDVIVEKPAFLQPEDFQPVREAASRSGRRVFVAENYFYKPLRKRLHRILTEGLIGDPLFLEVTAIKRQQAEAWRSEAALAGGGGLFEGGIHWINLMANLGLEVLGAEGYRAGVGSADRTGLQTGSACEESVLVVIRYAEGVIGTLAFSWEVPSPLRGLRISRIYGRRGTVTFESNGIFVYVQGTRTRLYMPGLRDIAGYRAMFIDFIDAIRTGKEPDMTLDMAERDVRLVRTVYRSLSRSPGVGGGGSLPGRSPDPGGPSDPEGGDGVAGDEGV